MSLRLLVAAVALLSLGCREARAQDVADYERFPRMARVVNVIYDSASVLPQLRSFPALRMRGRAIFDVWYAPTGQLDSIRWVDEVSAGHAVSDRLLEMLRAQTKPFVASEKGWQIRLAVTTGRRASLSLPDEQPPRLLNAPYIEFELRGICERQPVLCDTTADRTVAVTMIVDDRGDPRSIQVAKSHTGSPLGAEAVRLARGLRFVPGKVEGRPVPMLVQLPITFNRQ